MSEAQASNAVTHHHYSPVHNASAPYGGRLKETLRCLAAALLGAALTVGLVYATKLALFIPVGRWSWNPSLSASGALAPFAHLSGSEREMAIEVWTRSVGVVGASFVVFALLACALAFLWLVHRPMSRSREARLSYASGLIPGPRTLAALTHVSAGSQANGSPANERDQEATALQAARRWWRRLSLRYAALIAFWEARRGWRIVGRPALPVAAIFASVITTEAVLKVGFGW